jgi:hypothetical protein
MRPSSVSNPVATVTPTPRPVATVVPLHAMFERSPSASPSPVSVSVPFPTGWDSPVRAASVTVSRTASIIRRSAGTTLPASRRTMSPGTSSADGMSSRRP